MQKKSIDTSAVAIICYCILAISVTSVVAQEKSTEKKDAHGVSETSLPNKSADQSKSKPEHETTKPKTKSPSSKIATSRIPTAESQSIENSDTAPAMNASLLEHSIGSSPHRVLVPGWFTDTDPATVSIEAFGFTKPRLDSDIKSEFRRAANELIDELLGSQAHKYVHFSDQELRAYISREEVCGGYYSDDTGDQPCDYYFAHVNFGSSFKEKARKRWIETKQQSRLWQYGLISGAALLLIGFVFGGIKLNSATSGFYQGRLQFFVAVVILGIIAAGVYFGTKIDWI